MEESVFTGDGKVKYYYKLRYASMQEKILEIEISYQKLITVLYGALVVLEILLAIVDQSWLYLIPAALFFAIGAITTHSLIKDIKSLKQIRKLISELIDNDDGDQKKYSEVEA